MIEQGSNEWLNEKLGAITGTRAHDLMSSATTRRTLLATLIRELVTADAKTFRKPAHMGRGLDIEAEAVSYYSMVRGVLVTSQTAYIESLQHPMFACSPDGLIGEHGGYEGKRLDEENHIKILLGTPPEKEYVAQCHWNMWVTGRDWWDLHYYCETLPESMKSHVVRIARDPKIMRDMEDQAELMLDSLREFLGKHGLGGGL